MVNTHISLLPIFPFFHLPTRLEVDGHMVSVPSQVPGAPTTLTAGADGSFSIPNYVSRVRQLVLGKVSRIQQNNMSADVAHPRPKYSEIGACVPLV